MSPPKMSPQEITQAEIRIIRWGEKILTPLLVAGFIGIISFLIHVGNTVAQLSKEQEGMNGEKVTIYQSLEKLDEKISAQTNEAQSIKITIQRIDTNQQNFKEQIVELKRQNVEMQRQNMEIIRLLRTNANTERAQ